MSRRDLQFSVKEFIEWFQRLPKNTNTLRIFRRDGFYQIYGDYVPNIATEFLKSLQTISWFSTSDNDENSNSSNDGKIPCVSIKPKMCEGIIRDFLTRKGKNVEIYERDSDGTWAVANKASPGNMTGLEGCVEINNNNTQSYIMSVYVLFSEDGAKRTLGIGLCDSNSLRMEMTEMLDNKHYTNIQALLAGKGVKEAIIHTNTAKPFRREMEHLENILKKLQVGIADSTGKWPSFNSKEQRQLEQTIETLANETSKKRLKALLVNKHLALVAMNALINQWDLYTNNANHGQFDIIEYKTTSFMKLDAAATHALNLFPSITDTNTNMSLFGLLNKCRTPMGSRLLSSWIRQPLIDIEKIKRRQKLVTLFSQNSDVRSKLREDLMRGLPDLDKILARLRRNKATLKDCVSLYNFCQRIPWIRETLMEARDVTFDTSANDDDDGDIIMKSMQGWVVNETQQPLSNESKDQEMSKEKILESEYNLDEMDVSSLTPLQILEKQFIQPLLKMSQNFHNYMAMVEKVIDLEKVNNEREYVISASYDEILTQFDKEMKQLDMAMEEIRNEFNEELLSANSAKKNKDIVTLAHKPSYGWHLKISVTTKGLKNLPSRYNKIASLKNGILYSTRGLNDLSKQKQDITAKYNQRQEAIIKKVIEVTTSYIPVIANSVQAFSQLDVFMSFAHVASCAPQAYICPKILPIGSGKIMITKARHPCLEMQDHLFSTVDHNNIQDESNGARVDSVLTSRDMGQCIANDVLMIKNKSNFQIVTGPNMGGKSTYIRMIGLLSLMTQIGSFVPCEKATITAVDSILARVGAGDHQLKGLSTFMAEMLETGTILEAATADSLVIIDELGRGTSTYDGFGIAYSISEHIAEKLGCFCLFATHFHELTALANTLNGVVNKHVTAYKDERKNQLTMLYKIQDGPCDRSFGIQVAQLAKFPNSVIERAEEKAQELESFSKQAKISLQTFTEMRLLISEFEKIQKSNQNPSEYGEALKAFKQKLKGTREKNHELDALCKKILDGTSEDKENIP